MTRRLSTALFDIGTDRCRFPSSRVFRITGGRRGPAQEYSAATLRASRRCGHSRHHRSGKLPILVGGTGLYYRSLTRGFFPGPSRDEPCAQARTDCRSARPRAPAHATGAGRPDSAARISAARSQAPDPRARGVSPHRDRDVALRRYPLTADDYRLITFRPADSARAHGEACRPAGDAAVRPRLAHEIRRI